MVGLSFSRPARKSGLFVCTRKGIETSLKQRGSGRESALKRFQKFCGHQAVSSERIARQRRGPPQSKTSRNHPAGFQVRPQFLLNRYNYADPWRVDNLNYFSGIMLLTYN